MNEICWGQCKGCGVGSLGAPYCQKCRWRVDRAKNYVASTSPHRGRITDVEKAEIRRLRSKFKTHKEIARIVGVSLKSVSVVLGAK